MENPRTMSKKGAFARLWQAAIGLGIFILVVSLVALMVDEVRDQTTAATVARNVTDEGLDALELMADWQSIIVIAVVMIVIIGLILREFGYLGG
jgi:hypothetical protein